ncbi:hypothetical protein Dimus_036822 [Dionaea muscipula]
MDLVKILKVVSEKGGGHVGQSFQVLLGTTFGVAETSEPNKVIRTKKTKKATSEVAVVSDEEFPTDGTVGDTQESEAVASKSKPKRATKPKKKDVISPIVGENEMDLEAVDGEETQSDKAVEDETQIVEADVLVVGEEEQTRKRRRLRKATSTELAVAGDNEETQSNEDVLMERLAADSGMSKEGQTRKRRQKQVARTEPAPKRAKTYKGKVSPVELGSETRKEPVVSGSPTVEELDQQVDELLACPFVSEAVHEGEIDRGCMVRSCMNAMMGVSNHAIIKALHNVPLKHKCAILCRNMAETSLLTSDVLYNAVRTDDQRCRKINRLMGEKYALERELKELKFECDNAFEISSQMKADMVMVMEENQTLENENKELKTALEGEKNKEQTLEDKIKELQMVLEREKERQSKKNKELMKEKRKIVEERLHKQLDYARKEAIREFLSSEECSSKFNDDELIPELEKIELNPKVKYEKEPIPPIEGESSVWSEAYEADPMKFIKELGIERMSLSIFLVLSK